MTFVRCSRCLLPATRPSTHFAEGICSACRNFEKRKTIDWQDRQDQFLALIEKLPRNDSGYHVIVASSGGKDSTAQVVKMLELGVKPLVVTATTCHLTEVGRSNIDNLKRLATTIEYSPNARMRAILNRLGLHLVGDISLPEHMAIFSTPFRAAVDFGIPIIIYGESPTTEYGGPPGSEEHRTMNRRYIMEHQGFLGMRPMDFIGMEGICTEDMLDYILPSADRMKNITAYFLGQYFPWDSHENARVAIAHGLKTELPSPTVVWDFENLDNAQTGLHDHFAFLKYRLSRACVQLSVDIRHGRIDRASALERLTEIEKAPFPYRYMGVWYEDVLDRIGVSMKELLNICAKFTNRELFSEHWEPEAIADD